jgi:hypothetical protein
MTAQPYAIVVSGEELRAVFNALILATGGDGLLDDEWTSAQAVLARLRLTHNQPVGEWMVAP